MNAAEPSHMKPPHAAALALVGWYLMVPPFQGTSPENARVNANAPLNQWQKWAGFDSAKECNQASDNYYQGYLRAKRNLSPQKMDELAKAAGFDGNERLIFGPWMEQSFSHAICVPADDSQLNGEPQK
jgi:hypothetical protein